MAKKDDPFFVERGKEGRYKVQKPNSERASAVIDTQRQAIDWEKDHTDGAVHVEQVRNTDAGHPDEWGKP